MRVGGRDTSFIPVFASLTGENKIKHVQKHEKLSNLGVFGGI
jgi:hypothetical protein